MQTHEASVFWGLLKNKNCEFPLKLLLKDLIESCFNKIFEQKTYLVDLVSNKNLVTNDLKKPR